MPSAAEAKAHLPLHGEAANSAWKVLKASGGTSSATLSMEAQSPASGLRVRRDIELRRGESFARISETVTNLRKSDNISSGWSMRPSANRYVAQSQRALDTGLPRANLALGYEGNELLANDQAFRWPIAPSAHGGSCDLRQSFIQDGKGFVASVLLDTTRDSGFIAVFNPKFG